MKLLRCHCIRFILAMATLLTLAVIACGGMAARQGAANPTTPAQQSSPAVALQGAATPEVAATATLEAVIAAKCKQIQEWSKPKPGYVRIDQAQEHNGVVVRLIQGRFTTARTILEFEAYHTTRKPPAACCLRLFHVLPFAELQGVERPESRVGVGLGSCEGQEGYIMDTLGPVTDPERDLRIEFPSILMRTKFSELETVTPGEQAGERVEGPWVFQFAPKELTPE